MMSQRAGRRWSNSQNGTETTVSLSLSLALHVDKSRDLVADFRRLWLDHSPLHINGTTAEKVKSSTFLGVHMTEDFSWTLSSTSTSCRGGRETASPTTHPQILLQSENRERADQLSYNLVWENLQWIVRTAENIIRVCLSTIATSFKKRCICRTSSIVDGPPLYPALFTTLPIPLMDFKLSYYLAEDNVLPPPDSATAFFLRQSEYSTRCCPPALTQTNQNIPAATTVHLSCHTCPL